MKVVKEYFGVIICAVLLSIYFTYPLAEGLWINYFANSDFYLNAWTYAYTAKSVLDMSILDPGRFFDSPQMFPLGQALAMQDFFLVPTIILYLPGYLLTKSHIFATNLTIFTSFIFNFAASYFVYKKITKSVGPSLIGAFSFTFTPKTVHLMGGWLEYLNRFFVPIYFMLLVDFLRKPNYKSALVLFILYTLNWFTNIHYAIFITILSAVAFLVHMLTHLVVNKGQKTFETLVGIVRHISVGVLFVPLIYFFFSPYIDFSAKEGIVRSLAASAHHSLDLVSFAPPKINYSLEGYFFDYSVRSIYFPGFLAILCLIVFPVKKIAGIIRDKKVGEGEIEWIIYFVCLVCSVVISFGPYFEFNGREFHAPYYYLYKIFPLLSAIRSPERISYLWVFFVGYIIAIGLKDLTLGAKRFKKAVLISAFFLVFLLEYRQLYHLEPIKRRQINFDFKDSVVLFLPFREKYTKLNGAYYLFDNTWKDFRLVNGYTGSETVVWENEEAMHILEGNKFDEDWWDVVGGMAVEYVVIDRHNVDPESLRVFLADMEPSVIYSDADWAVIETKDHIGQSCTKQSLQNIEMTAHLYWNKYGKPYLNFVGVNKHDCSARFFGDLRYLELRYTTTDGRKIKDYLRMPFVVMSKGTFGRVLPLEDKAVSDGVVTVEIAGRRYDLWRGVTPIEF